MLRIKFVKLTLFLIALFFFTSCAVGVRKPPPPPSDTSGYTSSNASATSNLFVLKEVTSEFSVGDIVTFGDSKKEHEIWDAKVLKKIAMPDNTWVVLYHGSKFKISPGSGKIQGIAIKGSVGFVISPGIKVSVVDKEARNHQQEVWYLGYRNGKVGYYTEKLEVESQGNTNVAKYEGEMKYGVPNGQGTFTFTRGNKWVGEFRENRPWNITIYDKDGTILGKYVNGVEQ